jgi:hypothetical protein
MNYYSNIKNLNSFTEDVFIINRVSRTMSSKILEVETAGFLANGNLVEKKTLL